MPKGKGYPPEKMLGKGMAREAAKAMKSRKSKLDQMIMEAEGSKAIKLNSKK